MRIFILLFIGFPFFLQAQSDSCETLPMFFNHTNPTCEDGELDSSCFIINPQYNYPYAGQQWPGCGGSWVLNNPNWLTFVAGETQTELSLNISNCKYGEGTQIGIYEIPLNFGLDSSANGENPELLGAEIISNCTFAQCTIGMVEISVTTIPGQVYGIVLDGCNGDVCTVEIQEFQSGSSPKLDTIELGKVMVPTDYHELGIGPDTICLGAEDVPFYLPEAGEVNERFLWSKNGTPVDESNYTFISLISFPDTGNYDICAAATNYCDTSELVCKTVTVMPMDTFFMFDTICQDEEYIWLGTFDNYLGDYGPFSGDTSDYYFDSVAISPFQCQQLNILKLHVIDENEENPIPIDTFTNFTDLPFTIYGNDIIGPVKSKVIIDYQTESCDSFYSLDLEVFGGYYFISVNCGAEDVSFKFLAYNDTSIYTAWDKQFQIFENHPDFSYSAMWTANDSSHVLSDSLELVLSKEELRNLTTNNIGKINLLFAIMYEGDTIFNDTMEFEYDQSVYFLDLLTEVSISGDSLIAEDSLAFYQWLRCDSNFQVISDANNRIFQPEEDGYYAVEITKLVCKDTSECIYFPTITSTLGQTEESVRIIPNPTSGQFKIDPIPSSLLGEQYSVYSLTGELLLRNRMHEQSILDLSAYPAGIYILKIQNRVLRIVKI